MAQRHATTAFNLCQLGAEVTPGTGVAATTLWRGPYGSFEDIRQRSQVEENIGIPVPVDRTIETMQGVTIPLPSQPLTFEQGPYLGEAGVDSATPSGVGPYVYTYTFPVDTTARAIQTYTLELGNTIVATDVYEVPYCWLEEFTLSGKQGEAWQMEGTWQGQRLVSSSFTGSVAVPIVEEPIFANTELYIDDTLGGVGTTQKTGVLMDFSMRVRPGIMWVPIGDGTLYYQRIKYGKPEITFSIRYELEENSGVSLVATERAKYASDAIRLFSLKCAGTSGREFELQFAAKYDKPGGYEDEDENVNVPFEGRAIYSSGDSLFWNMIFTNNLSALT